MKRIVAAICAAMMLCGLAGCGTATMPDVTGTTDAPQVVDFNVY